MLPNIEVGIDCNYVCFNKEVGSGALKTGLASPTYYGGSPAHASEYTSILNFSASLSNPIYGNADEVRPKTMYGIWVIKAVGVVVDSVGNTDIAQLLNTVESLQNQVSQLTNAMNAMSDYVIEYKKK